MTSPTNKDAPVAGKWVPVEPTVAMLEAACEIGPDTNNGCFSVDDARSIYRAMLAVSTSSPEDWRAMGYPLARDLLLGLSQPGGDMTLFKERCGPLAEELRALLAAPSSPVVGREELARMVLEVLSETEGFGDEQRAEIVANNFLAILGISSPTPRYRCARCGRDEIDCSRNGCKHWAWPMEFV